MSKRDVERRIRDVFGGPLEERGFAPKKDVRFVREHGDAIQSISLPYEVRLTPLLTRRVRFDVSLANRFPVLQRLYTLEEDVARFAPAFASPLYLLRPGKKFDVHEWYLDARRTASTVLAQIDEFGIPYLNKYSDLGEVKRQLESESDSSSEWYSGLDSEGRACLLASIALNANDRPEALRVVDAAIEERKNARPEKRWYLEQFRKLIEARPA